MPASAAVTSTRCCRLLSADSSATKARPPPTLAVAALPQRITIGRPASKTAASSTRHHARKKAMALLPAPRPCPAGKPGYRASRSQAGPARLAPSRCSLRSHRGNRDPLHCPGTAGPRRGRTIIWSGGAPQTTAATSEPHLAPQQWLMKTVAGPMPPPPPTAHAAASSA